MAQLILWFWDVLSEGRKCVDRDPSDLALLYQLVDEKELNPDFNQHTVYPISNLPFEGEVVEKVVCPK